MPPDDSIHHLVSEGSGSETPPDQQPNEERGPRQEQEVTPSGGNGGGQPKPWMRSVVIFAALQACGTIGDIISSDLAGYWRLSIHWIALCCHVAGVFAVWHEGTPEVETAQKLKRVWMYWFGPSCLICLVVSCLVWWPSKPEPDPVPPLPDIASSEVGIEPTDAVSDTLLGVSFYNRNASRRDVYLLRLMFAFRLRLADNIRVGTYSNELVTSEFSPPQFLAARSKRLGEALPFPWTNRIPISGSAIRVGTVFLPGPTNASVPLTNWQHFSLRTNRSGQLIWMELDPSTE